MTAQGIDCAAPLTEEKAAKFKKLGYEFVGRYLCPAGQWKRLEREEAESISRAGLGLLCVWETTADRAKGGTAAGATDGARAYNHALELGMPGTGIIYFAVDFDAQAGDMDAIAAYLRAARAQTGIYEIGVYGSHSVIESMAARGICRGFWQCVAWSGGKISDRHSVYQSGWNRQIAGHTVDLNTCPDMDAAGIWTYEEDEEMKYEEFEAFMRRWEQERADRAEPEWSRDEGAWAKARDRGIMDGLRPESFVKRDELAAVLSRAGVFDGLEERADEV